mmetsp:Transcript_17518/g.32961  ORF Transcript_17518/g.32961 Transcript_17518/m.32961 type:complete len:307 (-) Transcript_17518:120-1040(-)
MLALLSLALPAFSLASGQHGEPETLYMQRLQHKLADDDGAYSHSLLQVAQTLETQKDVYPRDCSALVFDDCSFKTEAGAELNCTVEHASRLMYASWIRPGAHVLHVGARYGQTSCLISKVLEEDQQNSRLCSVEADPSVWDVLEANLAEHSCRSEVVRGVIGNHSLKVITPEYAKQDVHGYGNMAMDAADPRPGAISPAHTVESLGTTFDTLAIDCQGCFSTFLDENPILKQTLSMIIIEVHQWSSEQSVVDKLLQEGWEMKQHGPWRQQVLCKGPCVSQCDPDWVDQHAHRYWAKLGHEVSIRRA